MLPMGFASNRVARPPFAKSTRRMGHPRAWLDKDSKIKSEVNVKGSGRGRPLHT
jgi:hypothetical protein